MENSRFDGIINRIKNGDKDALREVYDEYSAMIYSIVSDIVQNRQDVEDICVDFFVKLWQNAGSYRTGGAHRKWLMTIARNMALDFLRKKHVEYPVEDVPVVSDGSSLEKNAEDRSLVDTVLSSLDADEREILTLKIMSGFTFKEIAEIMKKPLSTVTWKYGRIIEKVRGTYGDE